MIDHQNSLNISSEGIYFLSLGGIGEIGANCYLYCCDGKWIMIDLGLSFADEQFPGIDLLVPKIKFIEEITGKRYNNNVRKNITRLVREKVIRSKTTSNIIDDYNKAGGDKAIDQSLMGGKVLYNKEDLKSYFTRY